MIFLKWDHRKMMNLVNCQLLANVLLEVKNISVTEILLSLHRPWLPILFLLLLLVLGCYYLVVATAIRIKK